MQSNFEELSPEDAIKAENYLELVEIIKNDGLLRCWNDNWGKIFDRIETVTHKAISEMRQREIVVVNNTINT